MPSPFPGMDPYLEHESVFWGFHRHFAVEISYALTAQIRPRYIASIDVIAYFHEEARECELSRVERTFRFEERLHSTLHNQTATTPVQSAFRPLVEVIEVPYVAVLDREERKLVTVIDIITPNTKVKGEDRAAYRARRNNIRRSRTHFIEIDLLREGEPMPLTTQPDADYRIVLSRQEQRPEVMVWPIGLRDALPTIPVPLKSPDPDVPLDLQAVFSRVYDASAYSDYIYQTPLQQPLKDDDARWAAGILRESGLVNN